jgi:hypothetical protein
MTEEKLKQSTELLDKIKYLNDAQIWHVTAEEPYAEEVKAIIADKRTAYVAQLKKEFEAL